MNPTRSLAIFAIVELQRKEEKEQGHSGGDQYERYRKQGWAQTGTNVKKIRGHDKLEKEKVGVNFLIYRDWGFRKTPAAIGSMILIWILHSRILDSLFPEPWSNFGESEDFFGYSNVFR